MIDLGFAGNHFTWPIQRKIRHNLILERLDRFFANPEWLTLFEVSSVMHLPRTHLDYCPLLLNLVKVIPKLHPCSSLKPCG